MHSVGLGEAFCALSSEQGSRLLDEKLAQYMEIAAQVFERVSNTPELRPVLASLTGPDMVPIIEHPSEG
jgi:hypothetical protein